MQKALERDYPETVYENAWEDLMVIRESWKSVHGVDDQFCIELINEFANYIKNDIINKAEILTKETANPHTNVGIEF